MPGMYADEDYDLAGFCVGVVEKERIIDGSQVQAGDVLVGLASSGPHSNGYSLIRKVLETCGADLAQPFANSTLGEALLAPTRIYVKPLLPLLASIEIHALAHITGGGLPENLPRVLPTGTQAVINADSWQRPAIFQWLQEQGRIPEAEMLRTFNCGVGMVLVLAQSDVEQALKILSSSGETAWVMGEIKSAEGNTCSGN